MSLRYLTAGESHGPAIVSIIEGMPAGVPISSAVINAQLKRRQGGYGRGRRMQIEGDEAEILSGVRHGQTLGSPIALLIRNADFVKWAEAMAIDAPPSDPSDDWRLRPVTRPRPGHADLAGALKYDTDDARNILERASARETAMRVAVGTVARALLTQFGILIKSHVVRFGPVDATLPWEGRQPVPEDLSRVDASPVRTADPGAEEAMMKAVDEAKKAGETLGGIYEVIAWGVPPGLGSHVQWDRKLDGALARGLMSVQATKGVEIGLGFGVTSRPGSQVHDPIHYSEAEGIYRGSNHAGGIEGGMSNGEPIVVRVAVKPIATLYQPLPSIDMVTLQPAEGAIERSDVAVVPAAGVIGEAVVAFEIAKAFLEKFGGDSLGEVRRNYEGYMEAIGRRGFRRPADTVEKGRAEE